jgi:hypothetical protein
MSFEIERKFLVVNDNWRASVVDCDLLRDGLISECNGAQVRVRLGRKGARLAVKSSRTGASRLEFEYGIARADAEEMLINVCGDRIVEKTGTRSIMPRASGSSMFTQGCFPASSWRKSNLKAKINISSGRTGSDRKSPTILVSTKPSSRGSVVRRGDH